MLDRRPRYCWRTLKSPALFIHGRRGSLRPEFLKQVTPSNPVKNNCNRALPVCRPKISTKLGHTLQKVYTEGWLPSLNCTFCKGDGQPVGGCWNWGGGCLQSLVAPHGQMGKLHSLLSQVKSQKERGKGFLFC
jgi:hypothetical protein